MVRVALVGAIAVFCYGILVHLVHVIDGGLDPYTAAPVWLAAYFGSLILLDPLAAVLLLLRRRSGLALGCAILVTDAAANGYANYVLDTSSGITAGRIGQSVLSLLAVALLATAHWIRPWLLPPAASQ